MPKSISRQSQAVEVVQPPPTMSMNLMWDYPQPMPASDENGNIMFDVDRSEDLINWTVFYQTNQPPVPFDLTNGSGFYRVGAHYERAEN